MLVPKANNRYNTGKNAGVAVSLITAANKNYMTLSIAGTTRTIDTSKTYYAAGTDYSPDLWAFTFTDSSSLSFSSAGQEIVITIPIKNPPLVDSIVDDWDLLIKSEMGLDAGTIITSPSKLNSIE